MTLEEKLRQLTLTTMAQNLETMTAQAASRNLSFPAALEGLADLELEARHCRAIERRFKLSRLPAQPILDQFHFAHHKSRQQAKNRILRLLELDFLKQGTSVIIIGNPGVGKTFLAQIHKVYTEPTLLIVDDLGDLALDQQPSNLFYQVISPRHAQKRSSLITT